MPVNLGQRAKPRSTTGNSGRDTQGLLFISLHSAFQIDSWPYSRQMHPDSPPSAPDTAFHGLPCLAYTKSMIESMSHIYYQPAM
jgi:hypothetical protein